RLMAACSQSRSNSKSCPESHRRYGNSSLKATMVHDLIGWKQFTLPSVGFRCFAQRANCINELIDIFKSPMHRSVTQIGDLIDAAQFFKDFSADGARLNFAATGFEIMHDFID